MKQHYERLWAGLTQDGRQPDASHLAPQDVLYALRCLELYVLRCHQEPAMPGPLQDIMGPTSTNAGTGGDILEVRELPKPEPERIDIQTFVLECLIVREVKGEPTPGGPHNPLPAIKQERPELQGAGKRQEPAASQGEEAEEHEESGGVP